MAIGRYDTDPAALAQRLKSHDAYARYELNDWIFAHAKVPEGASVLDLGCGTGKQTLAAARVVGAQGSVLAIDVSGEALQRLNDAAAEAGLADRIVTLEGDLDSLRKPLAGRTFDRIIGSYSLYYATDPEALMDAIRAASAPGATVFICGPAHGNNDEIRRLHFSLKGEEPPPGTAPSRFMEETVPRLSRERFTTVAETRFENPMRFDSAGALLAYWRTHNLHDPTLENAMQRAATRHFETAEVFETVKRAVGWRLVA